MKIPKNILYVLFLLNTIVVFGQMDDYNYMRPLNGIDAQWHQVEISSEIFSNVRPDLSDIRIFGITESNDTIEAPYILKVAAETLSRNSIAFKQINSSHTSEGYFYTFEVPTADAVNHIKLDFDTKNFDWRVKLEGSQDQKNWFEIVDDYRILSLHNAQTDFEFTELAFPASKYEFYRLQINAENDPKLNQAKLYQETRTEGETIDYQIKDFKVDENSNKNKTEISIRLAEAVPVSQLRINLEEQFDYYRPIHISYVSDSTKTDKGWVYSYRNLKTGTLNSLEDHNFKFNSTILQKLKVTISNGDNQPLNITSASAKGYEHNLTARFTEPTNYYLVYGNPTASKPQYDIARFTDKIPATSSLLNLGDEQVLEKTQTERMAPLFENKIWLWAIMLIVIVGIGWLTLGMLRKK
ncbi:MAG: DUF3999 family protein [Mesonia sp.]|uniref:DUF3999 family protein n=1 Tax=Mesonia sp. TaxID=1960830 RepID=UPI003F9C05A1